MWSPSQGYSQQATDPTAPILPGPRASASHGDLIMQRHGAGISTRDPPEGRAAEAEGLELREQSQDLGWAVAISLPAEASGHPHAVLELTLSPKR